MKQSGYSGTPLIKKLGIKEGFNVQLIQAPEDYIRLLGTLPDGVRLNTDLDNKDFIHVFVRRYIDLIKHVSALKYEIKATGMIWISWPKKSSGVVSDLDGNKVRAYGLEQGLVDIKVCSINETWSALKFVVPVEDRKES